MIYIYLNDDKYIQGMGSYNDENNPNCIGIEESELDIDQNKMSSYRWDEEQKKFILDEAVQSAAEKRAALEDEYYQLKYWFDWYDNQVRQYERCQRLGTEFNRDIQELDTSAVGAAKRMTEIATSLGWEM